MKKKSNQELSPKKLALSALIITSILSFFLTILAVVNPALKSITPLLQAIYGPLGYTISFTGALIGAMYVAIDIFVLVYLFAWIYNKLL